MGIRCVVRGVMVPLNLIYRFVTNQDFGVWNASYAEVDCEQWKGWTDDAALGTAPDVGGCCPADPLVSLVGNVVIVLAEVLKRGAINKTNATCPVTETSTPSSAYFDRNLSLYFILICAAAVGTATMQA